MKTATLIVIGLMLSSVSWAQGGPDDLCSGFCKQVKDYSCVQQAQCTGNDCESIIFTAPCRDGDYILECEVVCTSGNCLHCRSIVCLTDTETGQIVQNCVSVGGDCDDPDCKSSSNVSLSQNEEYKLWVCLETCSDYPCTDCASCRAVATIYRSGATCPAP